MPWIRNYYMRKHGWMDTTMETVHWEGQMKAQKTFKVTQQQTLHQYTHNWMPTGDNMMKRYATKN